MKREKLLICTKPETNVSPADLLTAAASPGVICKSKLDKKEGILPTEEHNHLDSIHEDYHMALSSDTWPCGLMNVPQLSDETPRSEPFRSTIERGMSLYGCKSPTETCVNIMQESTTSSEELFSPMKHSKKENRSLTEHDGSQSLQQKGDFGIVSGFDKEETCNSLNVLELNAEVGEFQDIDLYDSTEDDEDYQEAIVSYMESRKKSYKETLARRFRSGLKLLKNKMKSYKSQKSFANLSNASGSD